MTIGHGVEYLVQMVQLVTGEPTTNALVFILILYDVVLCGISSACGLAFAIWRIFTGLVNFSVRTFLVRPLYLRRAFKREPLSQPDHPNSDGTVVTMLHPPPPMPEAASLGSSQITNDVVDSAKTSGVDSGSDHSVFSHPPSPKTTDPLIINQSKPDAPPVCQAHLVFSDRIDGVALPP